MKPIVRVILAIGTTALGIAPIAAALGAKEWLRTQSAAAESVVSSHLDTVTKDNLNGSCYQVNQTIKGAKVELPDRVPASSCVVDPTKRYGYIAVIEGEVRILDAFTLKQVNSRASELLKTTTK